MKYSGNAERVEKLEKVINNIIDQLEYLSDTAISGEDKLRMLNSKGGYDPIRDKIRKNSDVIWQLSTALTNLLMVKNSLSISIDNPLDFLLNQKRGQ